MEINQWCRTPFNLFLYASENVMLCQSSSTWKLFTLNYSTYAFQTHILIDSACVRRSMVWHWTVRCVYILFISLCLSACACMRVYVCLCCELLSCKILHLSSTGTQFRDTSYQISAIYTPSPPPLNLSSDSRQYGVVYSARPFCCSPTCLAIFSACTHFSRWITRSNVSYSFSYRSWVNVYTHRGAFLS